MIRASSETIIHHTIAQKIDTVAHPNDDGLSHPPDSDTEKTGIPSDLATNKGP